MRAWRLIVCLGVALARFCALAQGTFRDLDFEQANIIINPGGFISTGNAFPGWTVLADGSPMSEVELNGVVPLGAGIADRNYETLDGSFSALLAGSGLLDSTMSIAQSGAIPAGSESLTFAGSRFSVFFAGHALPLQALGSGPNSGDGWGANISAYAGQYGQLLFQAGPGGAYYLDDIAFSTRAIPEPAVLSILGLGVLMLSLGCRRRRARSAAMR
jgi:hypothetical protein